MLLGVIADDLTGASDIAGFIAAEGLSVTQYAGIPDEEGQPECDVAVVSLKSRSTPAAQAVRDSLAAMEWLRSKGCPRFYFKYCSTFDSTPAGNIGPVTDALMAALGADLTVLCPTLPANGRTVRDGMLLVNGVPLDETGMRHHPLNPMTDSHIGRLMEMQAKGKAGLVDLKTVDMGEDAVRKTLECLRETGVSYAVLDSESDAQLDVYAAALRDAPLLTGGSGLGGALARRFRADGLAVAGDAVGDRFPKGKTIVFSGSCSEMTNRQTGWYRQFAPEFRVEAEECLRDAKGYAERAAAWVAEQPPAPDAPLVTATVDPETLRTIQERFGGAEAAGAIERFFHQLAQLLAKRGYTRFIVAGGETSGSVSGALGVRAFRIGRQIAPGVSWVFANDSGLALAMKSGNFGDERFFKKAQELITEGTET